VIVGIPIREIEKSIKIISSTGENQEKTISQREDLLGKEMVFSGNVRRNNFFNNDK
jgi:hypothetical protein